MSCQNWRSNTIFFFFFLISSVCVCVYVSPFKGLFICGLGKEERIREREKWVLTGKHTSWYIEVRGQSWGGGSLLIRCFLRKGLISAVVLYNWVPGQFCLHFLSCYRSSGITDTEPHIWGWKNCNRSAFHLLGHLTTLRPMLVWKAQQSYLSLHSEP